MKKQTIAYTKRGSREGNKEAWQRFLLRSGTVLAVKSHIGVWCKPLREANMADWARQYRLARLLAITAAQSIEEP